MSLAVPRHALLRALEHFSVREVAYILYVLFEEDFERVVFVVRNQTRKAALEEFLSNVKASLLRKRVSVLTTDEYRDLWRELIGARIALVEEESQLKSETIETLARLIAEVARPTGAIAVQARNS